MKKINPKFKIVILLFLTVVIYSSTIYAKDKKNTYEKIDKIPVEIVENPIVLEEKPEPEKTTQKEVVYTCPKPDKEYEDMKFAYVGQNIGLPDSTYIPKNLKPLGYELATIPSICMDREALEAFRSMIIDAKKENLMIKAVSGFRSYNTQNLILESRISRGQEDVHRFVAKPGHSEHQLGTAVDISGQSINYNGANQSFHGTPEELWLRENAYKYGFVMSYPYGKEEITGYKYEPWHWRYIGIENATYIHDHNLTITEFLQ